MSKFILSKAMEAVPDDMLQEAMEVERKRPVKWVVFRTAACLAVVIGLLIMSLSGGGGREPVTMPGVLKAYACDIENVAENELEQYALVQDLEQSYKTLWSPYIDVICKGIAISVKINDDSLRETDIVMEVSTNFGELQGNHCNKKYFVEEDLKQSQENAKLGKCGTIDQGETVFWTGFEVLDIYATGEEEGKNREESFLDLGGIFVEFVVRAEGNIVGYAVMEIISVDYESSIFGIELRDSTYFPKVDGEYQNVTQKYIDRRIQFAEAG